MATDPFPTPVDDGGTEAAISAAVHLEDVMTREKLRLVVSDALDAIEAAETEATEKIIARDKIAKSATLTVDEAWGFVAALNAPRVYFTLELRITNSPSPKGPLIEWKYYDEELAHIEAKDLKSLLAKVKAAKDNLAAKPQTVDDTVAALNVPPLPALAETLAGEF